MCVKYGDQWDGVGMSREAGAPSDMHEQQGSRAVARTSHRTSLPLPNPPLRSGAAEPASTAARRRQQHPPRSFHVPECRRQQQRVTLRQPGMAAGLGGHSVRGCAPRRRCAALSQGEGAGQAVGRAGSRLCSKAAALQWPAAPPSKQLVPPSALTPPSLQVVGSSSDTKLLARSSSQNALRPPITQLQAPGCGGEHGPPPLLGTLLSHAAIAVVAAAAAALSLAFRRQPVCRWPDPTVLHASHCSPRCRRRERGSGVPRWTARGGGVSRRRAAGVCLPRWRLGGGLQGKGLLQLLAGQQWLQEVWAGEAAGTSFSCRRSVDTALPAARA